MDQAPHDEGMGWLTHIHIMPAGPARDARDGLLTLASGVAIIAMVSAMAAFPGLAAYALTGSSAAGMWGFMAGWIAAIYVMLFTLVHWLRIDAVGLRLGRHAGLRVVRWEDVTGIRPASRREVILHGWLFPPVPPREATRCSSSLGHYRIDHRRGYFYFPPADEKQFLGAVEFWRARHAERQALWTPAAAAPQS